MSIGRKNSRKYTSPTFTLNELEKKLGNNPKCYLTGQSIDLSQGKTYSLDHIIPVSRGGTCDLDNLGITTKQVNVSKTDMTPDEYIELCKQVLIHQGYKITKD